MSVHGERHQSQACFAGGGAGFLFSSKEADDTVMSVQFDASNPLAAVWSPSDPPMDGSTASVVSFVLHLLGLRGNAEIRSSIVQTITVDVIPFLGVTRAQSQKNAMHAITVTVSVCMYIGDGVSVAHAPMQMGDQWHVRLIDNGMGSDIQATVTQRHESRAVANNDHGQWRLLPFDLAFGRTEAASAKLETPRLNVEDRAAHFAGHIGAGFGTFSGHRLSPSGGVQPLRCATNVGAFSRQLYQIDAYSFEGRAA